MISPFLIVGFITLGFADPTITTVAGTGERGYAGDGGPADRAKLDQPFHLCFDRDGNLFFSDTNNHVVRRIDAKTKIITTVAGSGKKGYTGDGGPAVKATLNEPYGIGIDNTGSLYIVDRLNSCVRRVDPAGVITTIMGNGKSEYGGDGDDAIKARFKEPNGIHIGVSAHLVADVKDQRIRILYVRSNLVGTLCGTGERKAAPDEADSKTATLNGPRAVTVTNGGNILVVEREGNCVRLIGSPGGTMYRFAGTGAKGYTGDGGPALQATFDGPKEICCDDKTGDVYVVDTENEAIRKIANRTNIITTVAGKGKTKTPGLGDGGPATQATLGRPHGAAVGPDRGLYIADTMSNRIRVVK